MMLQLYKSLVPSKVLVSSKDLGVVPSKVFPRIQRYCLAPPPKIQLRQTGDGAAKGCSFCEFKQVWNVDWRQYGNSRALCYFVVVMELPDSLWMHCKSEFGVIFLRCSQR